MAKGKGGRPTKLTAETKERLVRAIQQGNYYEPACKYAGITYSAFRQWMKKGEAGEPKYAQFFEDIKKAEAAAEIRMIQEWQRQAPEDWKAIATFLERRYPDRWGKKDRIAAEHSGLIFQVVDDLPRGNDDSD